MHEGSICVKSKIGADLVFYDGIPEVIRKIARSDYVLFVLRVFGGGGTFGEAL